MKRFSFAVVLTFLFVSLSAPPALSTPSNKHEDSYISVTYPSQVKMPKKGCANIAFKYTLGPDAREYAKSWRDSDPAFLAGLQIWMMVGTSGRFKDAALSTADIKENGPSSGTLNLKYCVSKWTSPSGFSRARAAVTPGTARVFVMYEFGYRVVEYPGAIKFVR